MSKKLMDGVWITSCDWKNTDTGEVCTLGVGGEPAMFVDPDQGRDPSLHFQCGRHHGVIPQAEQEEFQLPEGHVLNETIMSNLPEAEEGIEDNG